MEIWRYGDMEMEIWRYGDMEIWRYGDKEIGDNVNERFYQRVVDIFHQIADMNNSKLMT